MSASITLQAALIVPVKPQGFTLSIPSGTVLTFPNAIQTGPFNQALDAAADELCSISQAAFKANLSEFQRNVTVDDMDYAVTYGPQSQATYTPYNVSPSASSSASRSASSSASNSPSSSASPSA